MFHGRIPWVGSAWTWCIYLSFKYKIKLSISQWFSVPCTSDRAQKNHFFHLKQQNKSAALTVNYRQPSNNCKRVPESANLLMLIKQEDVPGVIVEMPVTARGLAFPLVYNKGNRSALIGRCEQKRSRIFKNCKENLLSKTYYHKFVAWRNQHSFNSSIPFKMKFISLQLGTI